MLDFKSDFYLDANSDLKQTSIENWTQSNLDFDFHSAAPAASLYTFDSEL